jgi:putative ABC transport system permease protein
VRRLTAVFRESFSAARSQPVASVLTMVMVAGMVLAVMLTNGRSVGAEKTVLATIDSAGTRTIVVRAQDGAGITSGVLGRLGRIAGIEWVAAFSSATDATNSAIPEGENVPVRYAYGSDLRRLGIPEHSFATNQAAYASAQALHQLGMPDGAGGVTLSTGAEYSIAGRISTPSYMKSFEPLVLVPQARDDGRSLVNVVVVIVRDADLVSPISSAIAPLLAPTDPTQVTIQTSQTLADIHSLVQAQLSTFTRALVLALLGVTGVLVAVIMYGLVTMRRKDFGRRRALGATKSLIVTLLLIQTGLLALAGIAGGIATACVLLLVEGDPVPDPDYILALGVLTLAAVLLAALVPALSASRKEPIRELRVP